MMIRLLYVLVENVCAAYISTTTAAIDIHVGVSGDVDGDVDGDIDAEVSINIGIDVNLNVGVIVLNEKAEYRFKTTAAVGVDIVVLRTFAELSPIGPAVYAT
ncbi:unnamed protein product [Angiostrongylus costaricensis]|uniref:Secreted protein n=1 Tax=Angiostrongylus costaricensis TaxID=334426 RepID=A0A0R3PZ51_ANGCS|nr:unnamed protein product [Angiostrongylus costaricensis]